MKKKEKWLIVEDKKTYLLLLSVPLAIFFIAYDTFNTFNNQKPDTIQFITDVALACFLVLICIIFFVKLNTYSHWMNPDHPKSKNKQ